MELRPYQIDAVAAIESYLSDRSGDGVAVLPTGAGKTVIAETVIARRPDSRVVFVADRRELVVQAHNRFSAAMPDRRPIGIHSASVGVRQTDHAVLVAQIQSVYRRGRSIGHVDVLIVDEAHLVPSGSDAMYQQLIAELRQRNPALRVLGLTATPYRCDSDALIYGDGPRAFFDDLIVEVPVLDLIHAGYLAPVTYRGAKAATEIDTTGLRVRAGEFDVGQLEERAARVVREAVEDLVVRVEGRQRVLVFTCGIGHLGMVVEELRKHAPETSIATITGKTDPAERSSTLEAFAAGAIRFLVNVNVLTTGFDEPAVDAVVLLRAMGSGVLYKQCAGRGMRIAPGKTDLLLLDYGGNVQRFGLVEDPDLFAERTKRPPVLTCPSCQRIQPEVRKTCIECGERLWEAPPKLEEPEEPEERSSPEPRHGVRPYAGDVALPVLAVHIAQHSKLGKPDSLRVSYEIRAPGELLPVEVSEWICLEHGGWATTRAVRWWVRRLPDLPVPRTVADALAIPGLAQRVLDATRSLHVEREGRWLRIQRHVLERCATATT